MGALQRHFGDAMWVALVPALAASAIAAAVTVVRVRAGREWTGSAARVLAAGAVAVTLITTAWPRSLRREPAGDLILVPGRGGLGDFAQWIASPGSLAALLAAFNVLLYAAIAFPATLGWYARRGRVLVGCAVVSLSVEALQYSLEGRVAATDDFLLNFLGALIGYALARALRRPLRRLDDRVTPAPGG